MNKIGTSFISVNHLTGKKVGDIAIKYNRGELSVTEAIEEFSKIKYNASVSESRYLNENEVRRCTMINFGVPIVASLIFYL